MSLTAWNEDIPSDNNLAGEGNDEIASLKARVKERLELDHQFSGELDPLEGDCDGYHKKITLKALDDDPTPLTGTGMLYTKDVDGIIELFFKDATSGVVNQLTEQGVLSLNTLANDINGNHKKILNSAFVYQFNPSSATLISITAVTGGQTFVYKYYTLEIKKGCYLNHVLTGFSLEHGSFGGAMLAISPFKSGNDPLLYENIYSSSEQVTTSVSLEKNVYLPVGFYYIKVGTYRSSSAIVGGYAYLYLDGVSDDDVSDAYTLTLKGTGWA